MCRNTWEEPICIFDHFQSELPVEQNIPALQTCIPHSFLVYMETRVQVILAWRMYIACHFY